MVSGVPISLELIKKLKEKLNVGNLRSIQLNCIPGKSSTRLDISDLLIADEELPHKFIQELLDHSGKLSFEISFSNLNLNLSSDSDDEDRTKKLGLISKRLNSLNNYNKEDLQEYGYESFGFGYPIVVFSPQEAPDKVIKAPLFIWHLTIEKVLNKTNTWKISRTKDHEIEFNNLLRSYIGQLSNTKIEGFSEEELIDGVLDLDELLTNAVKFVKNFDRTEQVQFKNLYKAEFEKGIVPIPSKKKCEESATGIPHIYWGGVFGRYHQRNEAIRQELNDQMSNVLDSANDDVVKEFKDLMHAETAALSDPSQIGILNYLKDNKHLIIQGPPGTGKSESITGIIINALEHGKKCLVVCEKKTAMDILKKNLTNISPEIGNLVAVIEDVSRDRKNIVDSVRLRHESIGGKKYQRPPETNLAITLEQIESYIEDIHFRKKFFYEEKVIDDLTTVGWTAAVGKELGARFKNKNEQLLKELKSNVTNISNADYNQAEKSLGRLEEEGKKLGYKNLLKWIPDTEILEANANQLKVTLLSETPDDVNAFDLFIDKFEEKINQTREVISLSIEEKINEIDIAVETLENNMVFLSKFPDFKKDNIWYKLIKISPFKSEKVKNEIFKFEESYKSIEKISELYACINIDLKLHIIKDIQWINEDLSEIKKQLEDLKQSINEFKFRIYDSILVEPFLDIQLNKEIIEELSFWKKESENILSKYYPEEVNWDSTDLTLNILKWCRDFTKNIIAAEQDGFLNHLGWQLRLRKEPKVIQELVDFFLKNNARGWSSHFSEYYFHDQLNKNLNTKFSGGYDTELKFLKKEREKIVDEIKAKIPKYWKAVQSEINGNTISIKQIYNKRGGRGQRRNSLRKIAEISFDSLTSYFPVMMVSPNVCASMFKLEPDLFDYVIFDEASQLKVEESLTTLIRGERKVVSGDSNQMPPSYWFTAQNDTEDLEEDEYDPYKGWKENLMNKSGARDLAESESLLEFSELCQFQPFHLDFHYRCYHPLLIEFSNAAFYKSRLHPLPKRIFQSPIQFITVDGTYENQQNRDEANVVIEVLRQLKTDANGDFPSVGIATFNQKQKNLIWELLKREAQLDSSFRTRYRELEEKGLFVKNLENIQGDERDIIILSTTYGRDRNGKAIRNYGPMTRTGLGHRLLNVIITRAKKKIFVLTSIPEENYMEYKHELGGSQILERGYFHAYLAYAKAVSENDQESIESILNFLKSKTTKIDSQSLRLTESPFEEAVYQALSEEIDSDRITLQYKAGGFRIDIAIKSKITGKEYLAIECDGAAYHSSVEAYAWDNYRQEILEEYGFIFHRIWSRDFWENSDREIKKLVKFINEQDEKDDGYEVTNDPVASDIFIEDAIEDISSKKEISLITESEDSAKTEVDAKNSVPQELALKYLEDKRGQVTNVGDILNLEELDSGKKIKATFKKGVKKVYEENGITVLDEKSPLGEAVIGRKVGETVEINNIEKYYKILEIV